MKNKQLIPAQRRQIQSLLQVGASKKQIAEPVDTSVSSICRETGRNKGKRGCSASIAQQYCDIRRERYRGKRKLTESMEKRIRDKLTGKQRSPQQTVGQAKLANIPMISHGRICQLIRKDGAEGGLL